MTECRRGRSSRDAATVTPAAMMAKALDMLDRAGAEALTMRALARRAGVNPMTIHHHFGSRKG